MKPIVYGAVLAVLWLLSGLPVTVPSSVVVAVTQPVTVVFLAGVLARPHLVGRRWSR